MGDYRIWYHTDDGSHAFSVTVPTTASVSDLMRAIKDEMPAEYDCYVAAQLKLYLVGEDGEPLDHRDTLSKVFEPNGEGRNSHHILVRLPKRESVDSALGVADTILTSPITSSYSKEYMYLSHVCEC
jgi:hypothetical protein